MLYNLCKRITTREEAREDWARVGLVSVHTEVVFALGAGHDLNQALGGIE